MSDETTGSESVEALREYWKTTVGVQMHFNDMLMRIRTLAATVVVGVFGAAAALVGQSPERLISLGSVSVHVSAVVVVFGLLLLLCVFVLDYLYYYRLLLAAVCRGEAIERAMGATSGSGQGTTEAGLTLTLSGRVSRCRAATVVLLFYCIPFLAGLALLLYLLCGYKATTA